MKSLIFLIAMGIVAAAVLPVGADTIELSNGDQVTGKIVDINERQVVIESELLGKVILPREKVTRVQLESGSATVKKKAVQPKEAKSSGSKSPVTRRNPGPGATKNPGNKLSDARLIKELQSRGLPIKSLDELQDLIPEISLPEDRQQSPEDVIRKLRRHGVDRKTMDNVQGMVPLMAVPGVRSYFDSALGGLISGRLDLHDIRQDALKARDGLRDLQKDLGPSGDALNGYLLILEGFLEQTEEATSIAPEESSAT